MQKKRMLKNKTHFKQPGVSFIEILVVLMLISLTMSFTIPRFINSQKGAIKKHFAQDFAKLISNTMHQAILTSKVHQVFFDNNRHEIMIKIFDETSQDQNRHKMFKPVEKNLFNSTMQIPDSFVIQNFFINGEDEVKSGTTMNEAWFYIMPDGTSQHMIINIINQEDQQDNKFCITINPFYSQVSIHDTFQKP